jgi:hypothetical protein
MASVRSGACARGDEKEHDLVTRRLAPTLAAVAVFCAPASAADRDSLVLSGWSDNILNVADDDYTTNSPTTAKDDAAARIGFSTNASLKADWTVASRMHARINLWLINTIGNGLPTPTNGYANPQSTVVALRESYLAVDLEDGWSWWAGKYINSIGWIGAEPTAIYRVNPSTIGYTQALYGNDVVGTAIACRPKGAPISASLHVVNGFFDPLDTYNNNQIFGHPTSNRENFDLGYMLDFAWLFGRAQSDNKPSNLDFELVYDPHGGANTTAAGQRAGTAVQAGLNGTIRAGELPWNKDLTLGGEVIWRDVATATQEVGGTVVHVDGTHTEDFGWMLLGNLNIGGGSSLGVFKMPASLTLSFQQFTTDWRAAGRGESDATEYAVALLTNPLDNKNFGMNYEVAWDTWQNRNPNRTTGNPFDGTDNAWVLSVEAIAVIP